MISINRRAMKLVREILEDPGVLGVKASRMTSGVTVIDMGVHNKGSWKAGELFTRITLGDLGLVQFGHFRLDEHHLFAAVELFVDQPLIACLGSQIAGWQLGEGEFATIGSGPARSVAAVETDQYLNMTPYRDDNDEVVLCVQGVRLPDDRIGQLVAEKCRTEPENVYLVVAPSASLVGSIQVPARMLELVCHKMYAKGFDVSQVVSCHGIAPIPPLIGDEVKAIGRINDALIYGAEAEFWVDSTDDKIASTIDKLVSKTSSPEYGKPFAEIFEAAGRDFYYINHDVHSIAKLQIHNINTGKSFTAGEIYYKLLRKSFLS